MSSFHPQHLISDYIYIYIYIYIENELDSEPDDEDIRTQVIEISKLIKYLICNYMFFSHTNISCSMCIKSVCIHQQQRTKVITEDECKQCNDNGQVCM